MLWWPSGSHLPCEMEVCTAKKSDIINHSPGMRVPADTVLWQIRTRNSCTDCRRAGLSRVPEQERATRHAVAQRWADAFARHGKPRAG